MHKGSCLCGAVTFEVTGALSPPDACHWFGWATGHGTISISPWGVGIVSAEFVEDDITLEGGDKVGI
jgi:hypothetical protein